jgi:hypothetical protein
MAAIYASQEKSTFPACRSLKNNTSAKRKLQKEKIYSKFYLKKLPLPL